MGIYLNPGNAAFSEAVHSQIYVDKTELISYTNSVLATNQKNICVSRPRRFGKSITANMLAAYYSKGCQSDDLFKELNISSSNEYKKYLNTYMTIFLNIQEFLSRSSNVNELIQRIQRSVMREIRREYPELDFYEELDLTESMKEIYAETNQPFIVIIDEWDCIFREYADDKTAQECYLDFLRDFLKDKPHIHLAYMTGILPIKKYGTHSALNMFDEFSMANPGVLAQYVGFTEDEVAVLCQRYHMNLAEIREWYDGYRFEKAASIYSPRSVVAAMTSGICDSYWNQTETFEALREYIDMNFDGLKDDVLSMMAGEMVPVNTGSFSNDMTTFHSEDDVLTLLIHLGYLGYDFSHKSVFIPNNEIRGEFVNAVSVSQWGEVSKSLKNSADLLNAIWRKDAEKVTVYIQNGARSYESSRSMNQALTFEAFSAEISKRNIPFGSSQMLTLKMIGEDNLYTNLALLLSDQCEVTTKVAIFQGTDKATFRDRKEFSGSIIKQLDDVYQFIDLNNKTKASFSGLERIDKRDYPEEAVREALLNSIVHRDYSFSGSNLINIYDDRIEFVSLGGLVPGLELDSIFLGVSQPRNLNLAAIFYRMMLIESYGTGISKIQRAYENFSKHPLFETAKGVFRVTLPNRNETNLTNPPKKRITAVYRQSPSTLADKQHVLEYVSKNKKITRKEAETLLNSGTTKAFKILKELCESGKLQAIKSGKNTYYTLV